MLNAIYLTRIFTLVITLNLAFALLPEKISAQQDDVNYQEFYDELSPYGQWIEDNNYGYVWIPTAGPYFTPYLSNGYWLLTNYGWMWVSNYDWGWATFHYGRWDYNGSYGWFWVPDNEWGPSWVTWRWSVGYYGWAPMRPGVSISITFGGYNDVPNDRWVFVRDRDIERHDIADNYIDRRNNITIINNSTVINKTYYDDKRRSTYVAGPSREDVQKVTGRTIKPIAVQEKDKPGQSLRNDQLQIYRPQVQKNKNGNRPAPTELTKYNDVKRIIDRDSEKRPQNTQQQNNRLENRQQQTEANSSKKVDNKNQTYQQRNLDPPNKEKNKDQSPQMRNPNPPIDNSSKNKPNEQRYLDPPRKENTTDRKSQPQDITVPKNNKIDKPAKDRTVISPKKNETDKPAKLNPDEDKNVKKNPK